MSPRLPPAADRRARRRAVPALAELEQRVLNHDPALVPPEPAGRPLRGYRLGERLGTGRDGTVYAARLSGVERDFAIRVIRQDIADRPEFVRAFEAGAQRLSALRHPGILQIHDYWREPGAAYLVMRRMTGGSLADRLERGPLSDAALGTLITRIGGALVAAAAKGSRTVAWPRRACSSTAPGTLTSRTSLSAPRRLPSTMTCWTSPTWSRRAGRAKAVQSATSSPGRRRP